MEYRLRKAIANDTAVINDLFIEMLRSIYGNEVSCGYNDGDLDHCFSGGEDWICLAEVDGKTVAFLSIEVHREDENYLYYDDFSVSKDYRNLGIGTALMNEAEKYGKSIDFKTAVLHVEKSNICARKFYEHKGFVLLDDEGVRLCLVKHFA